MLRNNICTGVYSYFTLIPSDSLCSPDHVMRVAQREDEHSCTFSTVYSQAVAGPRFVRAAADLRHTRRGSSSPRGHRARRLAYRDSYGVCEDGRQDFAARVPQQSLNEGSDKLPPASAPLFPPVSLPWFAPAKAFPTCFTDLYSSVNSQFCLQAMKAGADICITVTLLDGLVLARSVFHHSMNYRSVVLFGRTQVTLSTCLG